MDFKQRATKSRKLKDLLRSNGFQSLTSFAISQDLSYQALCATVSGRAPVQDCVDAIKRACGATEADFPRLPRRYDRVPRSSKGV
jgi:hypothetical protein